MIAAQDKTGNCGFFAPSGQSGRRTDRRKTVLKSEKLVLTCLVVACFAVGLFITYYFSQLFILGYQINCLNKELAALRLENHGMEEEIKKLVSLENIEYLAVNKLKMVKPDARNILLVTVAAPEGLNAASPDGGGKGQQVAAAAAGKEKNRLIQAFDELVNRFAYQRGLESVQGNGFREEANANNKHTDSQKNNTTVSDGSSGFLGADYPSGLDSTS